MSGPSTGHGVSVPSHVEVGSRSGAGERSSRQQEGAGSAGGETGREESVIRSHVR